MTENGDVKSKKARLEDDPFRWPGYTGEAYPELCDIRAMPPQPKESELKPGQLPEKLIRQYFEEVPYTKHNMREIPIRKQGFHICKHER